MAGCKGTATGNDGPCGDIHHSAGVERDLHTARQQQDARAGGAGQGVACLQTGLHPRGGPAVGRSRVSVQQRLVRGVQFFLHPLVYRIGESAGEIGEGGQRIGGPAGRGQGVHNGDGK